MNNTKELMAEISLDLEAHPLNRNPAVLARAADHIAAQEKRIVELEAQLSKFIALESANTQLERIAEDRKTRDDKLQRAAQAASANAIDAERYRWLRENGIPELCACINGIPSYIGEEFNTVGKSLDATIDAAMKSTK